MIKSLPNVTIVCVACNKYGETLNSLYRSLKQIKPFKVLLFTDTELKADGIDVIKISKLDWVGYNTFILREVHKYVETEFFLIQQWDSWVLNSDCWDDKFYEFDVVGAKWGYKDGRNVANGGFSLRTKRLHEIVANDKNIELTYPEDEVLGRLYRTYLEKEYGIKFCDEETADKFSFELHEPIRRTFGFHAFHHLPFKEHIVIKRSYAMGDIIMAEPLVEYYSKKGYQVVMDIPVDTMGLFAQYPYYVKHISEMKEEITPLKYINLDMAYEKKPKQLVLKSYYEAAGIEDGELRNSNLNFNVSESNRLFRKYAIVHIDKTGVPSRNIREVDWEKVVKCIESKGYHVFQVGQGTHEKAGIFLNMPTKHNLMFAVAGASLVVGIDSGVTQIGVALGIPSVIFFGSVNAAYRYADFDRIKVVQNKCVHQHCYHEAVSEVGVDCVFDKEEPPCTFVKTKQIIDKINELI